MSQPVTGFHVALVHSIALDAATGRVLWHYQMGGAVYAAPMAYAVDGKEYVAIAAGSALFVFTLP